jgi:hypothetical protein
VPWPDPFALPSDDDAPRRPRHQVQEPNRNASVTIVAADSTPPASSEPEAPPRIEWWHYKLPARPPRHLGTLR